MKFIGFDETPIFYNHWKAEGDCRGTVLMVHGMGEHGGRYAHVAAFLAGLGLETAAPDLRGFGQSGGPKASVRSIREHYQDILALHNLFFRRNPARPLFLLGHSFGGLLCAAYTALISHPPIRGLVLSSPLFGFGFQVPFWRHCLGTVGSIVSPHLPQPTSVDTMKLTHDSRFMEAYQKDSLICQRISPRLYTEMRSLMSRRRQIASALKLPVLLAQAGEDAVVDRKKAELFFQEIDSTDKTLEIYEGFYHEILNETGRDQVMSRIGNWVLERSV
ncbi:MAG: lysophospholipase [Candidatus Omnitrophica bacterium]|nr:lysophospholipase [Candidatus Omnitrophota bacterium]